MDILSSTFLLSKLLVPKKIKSCAKDKQINIPLDYYLDLRGEYSY